MLAGFIDVDELDRHISRCRRADPRCGSQRSHFIASRRRGQCRCCRYQSSVTAGTVYHGTRVPLRVWFLGSY
jgi:hypothetical protein